VGWADGDGASEAMAGFHWQVWGEAGELQFPAVRCHALMPMHLVQSIAVECNFCFGNSEATLAIPEPVAGETVRGPWSLGLQGYVRCGVAIGGCSVF
jgi:hypothetical protein